MSNNQPPISNLVSGIKNNIDPKLVQNIIPQNFQPNIQPTTQYSAPKLIPQNYMEQSPNAGNLLKTSEGDNTMKIFGQSIQKKYVYIIGFIVLVIIGYFIYKWYFTKKTSTQESDDEDEDDEEDEVNYENQLQFNQNPTVNNDNKQTIKNKEYMNQIQQINENQYMENEQK